jgi:antitoxin component of MazEF toxin-antitoxin module
MALARQAGIEEGSMVDVVLEGGCIVLKPLSRAASLEGLLARVTPENQHDDLDWRPADLCKGCGR